MSKISVLIIAHNEEKYISKCIKSLLNQTQKADEIVLIVHNSSDNTLQIANKYSIDIISFNSSEEIIYARIEGLKNVVGDIILCIDGDSYAKKNWVEVMTKTLKNGNILIGSWIKIKGTLFGNITNIFNKYLCILNTKNKGHWIWGPSFAFWSRDKEKIRNIFEKSIELTKKLNLSRNPDDYWLALFLNNEGKLEITNKTNVTCHQKESSSVKAICRNFESLRNGNIMRHFWRENIYEK